jgi:hypothetical protein
VLPGEGFYPGGHESEMMMRECAYFEALVLIKHEVGPFQLNQLVSIRINVE